MFKRAFAIVGFLLLLALPAMATQVTMLPTQVPQANITGLPADVTGTATVTNGSAAVTITSNFRTAWIGVSGYLINLPAGDFYVAATASGGALTLSTNYTGGSGSVSYRVYPWVLLKIYADRSYTPLNASYVVQPGVPGSSNWYVNKAVTVKGGQIWLPQMILDATTDAVNPAEQAARLAAFFYRQDGSLVSPYACFTSFRVPPSTPTSWTALCSYNQTQTPNPPDTNVYTRSQIDAFLPVCSAGQMPYYSATGRVMACLTVGAGLDITGGVITSSGGGGGSGVWSSLSPPVQNLTMNHSAWSTSFIWNTNTGSAPLFNLETGTNDIGTGYILQLQAPGGSNLKAPLRASARGSDSLVVTAAGLVGVNRGSPTAQLDVLADTTTTPGARVNVPASATADILQLQNNGVSTVRFVPAGTTVNSVFGSAALAPGATNGFVYIPSVAGVPSGTPTSYTGTVPLVVDTTNNRLYGFSGVWRNLTGTGGGGGGSTIWSDLTSPTANSSLNHYSGGTNYTTSFNWNSATSTSSLFTLTTGTNDTGSGAMFNLLTPGATNGKNPLQVTARDVSAMRIRYDGQIGFGELLDTSAVAERFVFDSEGINSVMVRRHHAGGSSYNFAPIFELQRSRGIASAQTPATGGDSLGVINFKGYTGAGQYSYGARISTIADDTVISGAVPTQLSFWTAPVGTLIERMIISSSGLVGVPTIATGSPQFSITSSDTGRGALTLAVPDVTSTTSAFTIRMGAVDLVQFIPFHANPTGAYFDTVLGGSSLIAATDGGFVFYPTVPDTPTGTPVARTGTGATVIENDTSAGEYRMWAYLNGAWRNLSGGGGGGSSIWSTLTPPVGNLTLPMSTFRTSFEWSAGTGTTTNLFTLKTANNEPDSGYLLSLETAGSSSQKGTFRAQARGVNSLSVEANGDVGIGVLPTLGAVHIAKSTTTGLTTLYKAATIANTGALATFNVMEHLLVTDVATGNYGTLASSRIQFAKSSGSSSSSALIANWFNDAAFDQSHSGEFISAQIAAPTVASGKTLAIWRGLLISAPTGAGVITGSVAIGVAAGAGSSGFGTQNATAQVHVISDSNTKPGMIVSSFTTPTASILELQNNTTAKVKFVPGVTTTTAINSVFSTAALSPSATDGYVWLPNTTGAPVGTPTTYAGATALVIRDEVANYKLYGYLGGNWVDLSGGAGGSTAWSSISPPAGNLSLSMAATQTAFTWGSATLSNNLFTIATGATDTGTGYLMSVSTPGPSNAKSPLQVSARGVNSIVVAADGNLGFGGITTPTARFHYGDGNNVATTLLVQGSGISSQANLTLATSQGTLGSISALGSGAQSGTINFQGANNAGPSVFVTVAAIGSGLDGPNAASPPGYLTMYTRASGSGTLSGRVTIDQNGRVGIPLPITATQLGVQGQAATDSVATFNTTASATGSILKLQFNSTTKVQFTPVAGGDVNSVFGSAVLAPTATNGFVYLPTASDAPTNAPTAYTGTGAVVIENDSGSSQYYLWGYLNGAWRNLTGTGGGGGSTVWSNLTDPAGNLSLNMFSGATAYTSTFTSNATTSTNTPWTFKNGNNDTGTGSLLVIETPGATNTKAPFRISHRTATQTFGMNSAGELFQHAYSSVIGNIAVWHRGRGSEGSPTHVVNGDVLGQLRFSGVHTDASTTIDATNIGAIIQSDASGDWNATDKATDLRFRTGNATLAAPSNTMLLTSDQRVAIGPAVAHADATKTFNVLGTGRLTGQLQVGTGDGSGGGVPAGVITPTTLYLADGTASTPSTSTSPTMSIIRRWNATAVAGSGTALHIHHTNDKVAQSTMEVASIWSLNNGSVNGDRIGMAVRMISEGTPGSGTSDFAFWGTTQKWTRVDSSGQELNVDHQYSRSVSAASNASPIVITVTFAHYLTTGDEVYISGVLGNTAANGTMWTVTVLNSTQFSLNTSVGSGTYTSGGTVNLHSARDYATGGNRAIGLGIFAAATGNHGNITTYLALGTQDSTATQAFTGIDFRPGAISSTTHRAIRMSNSDFLTSWNAAGSTDYKLIGMGTGNTIFLDSDGRTISAGSLPVQWSNATGQILTSALTGTIAVANGGTGQSVASTVRAYNSAAISIPNNAETGLTFDSERYDSNTLHSTSTNTGRLTATVAGTYVISANIGFAGNTTGIRYAYLRLNGTTLIAYSKVAVPGTGSADDAMLISTNYQLSAGQYIEIVVFQNSGGALNITSGPNHSPEFSMVRVSD